MAWFLGCGSLLELKCRIRRTFLLFVCFFFKVCLSYHLQNNVRVTNLWVFLKHLSYAGMVAQNFVLAIQLWFVQYITSFCGGTCKSCNMSCVHFCIYPSLFSEVKLAESSSCGCMPSFPCEILEYLPSENNGKDKVPGELPEVSLTFVLYVTMQFHCIRSYFWWWGKKRTWEQTRWCAC